MAWSLPPSCPSHVMADTDWTIATQMHLAQGTVPMGSRCINTTKDGRTCNQPLDAAGIHWATCPCGGARVSAHNAVRDAVAGLCRAAGCTEVHTETLRPDAPGRYDVTARKPDGSLLVVDVTIASPLTHTAFASGAAHTPGTAAARAEANKRAHYAAAATGVTCAAWEVGGRPGPEAHALIRKLCPYPTGPDRTIWLKAAWQTLAVTFRRALVAGVRSGMQRGFNNA